MDSIYSSTDAGLYASAGYQTPTSLQSLLASNPVLGAPDSSQAAGTWVDPYTLTAGYDPKDGNSPADFMDPNAVQSGAQNGYTTLMQHVQGGTWNQAQFDPATGQMVPGSMITGDRNNGSDLGGMLGVMAAPALLYGGEALAGAGGGAVTTGGTAVADTTAGTTAAAATTAGGGSSGLFGTGMTLKDISTGLSIATSLNSISGGALFGNNTVSGSQAQNNADPFAPYRPGVANQYATALQSGGTTDPTKMPGYSQWMSGVLNPAMSAVAGKDASMGLQGSTNEQTDLLKTAQNQYYGFMTDYMNRLAQASGAVNNPAPAAGQGLGQSNLNQAGVAQGVGGLNQGIQTLSGYNSNSSIPMINGGGFQNTPAYLTQYQNPTPPDMSALPVDSIAGMP